MHRFRCACHSVKEAALSKGGLLHRYLSVSCSRSLGKPHHKLQHVTIRSATRIPAAAIRYMPARAVTPMEAVLEACGGGQPVNAATCDEEQRPRRERRWPAPSPEWLASAPGRRPVVRRTLRITSIARTAPAVPPDGNAWVVVRRRASAGTGPCGLFPGPGPDRVSRSPAA